MVNATGPLTKDDTLLYRVNLAYENSGSFRNFIDRKSVFIAPTVTWNISPRTQATAEFEYQHISSEIDGGIAPMGNRPAPVPISRNLDEPIFNGNVSNRFFGGVNLSHEFNER